MHCIPANLGFPLCAVAFVCLCRRLLTVALTLQPLFLYRFQYFARLNIPNNNNKMAGYDDLGIYFSDNIINEDGNNANGSTFNFNSVKKHFKVFLRNFHTGDFNYKYRDQIKEHFGINQFWIEVSLNDLGVFNDELADKVNKSPIEHLKIFEIAATELTDEITKPRVDDAPVKNMQVRWGNCLILFL